LDTDRALLRTAPIALRRSIRCANAEEFDLRQIAALLEIAVLIVDIGDTAAHARCKIAARPAQHRDDTASHIFAAMVACAFHDGDGPRIADREALPGDAIKIGLTRDRAVEHRVADNDVFGRVARQVLRRANYDASTRQA